MSKDHECELTYYDEVGPFNFDIKAGVVGDLVTSRRINLVISQRPISAEHAAELRAAGFKDSPPSTPSTAKR